MSVNTNGRHRTGNGTLQADTLYADAASQASSADTDTGKPRTVQRLSAKEIVKIHMALGGKNFAKLSSREIGKWMEKQIGRPITYNNVKKLIKEFDIKYAVGSKKTGKTKAKQSDVVYSLVIELAKIVRDMVDANADKFGDFSYKEVKENLTQLIARRRVSDRGDTLVLHCLAELTLICDSINDDEATRKKLANLFDRVK